MEKKIRIELNGFADGPGQALRDYFNKRAGVQLTVVQHPLATADGTHTVIEHWSDGTLQRRRQRLRPNSPPWSYPLDLALGWPSNVDVWFGFTSLATIKGLGWPRIMDRKHKVVHWCVDFVPERFGNSLATRMYDAADRYCCAHADYRIELSQQALDGRLRRHGLDRSQSAEAFVVPMGAWLDRTPRCEWGGERPLRVVYMGHLVERQGVHVLLDAVARLHRVSGEHIELSVIGDGPMRAPLEKRAAELGIASAVTFHGFVAAHERVEHLLAKGTVGVAPYLQDPTSFTQFADPGKLKAYLAAALPIVLTPVPPNADVLEREAGAIVVPSDADSLARAIAEVHRSPLTWAQRSRSATAYARQFDWTLLFDEVVERIGLWGTGTR